MSIEWISVKERVPDNRREVLVWGCTFASRIISSDLFLGTSRYNHSKNGGRFDCERATYFGSSTVTHWAEITGPRINRKRK